MIILASKSPRRKELLEGLGLEIRCESPKVDESHPEDIKPDTLVMELAMRKAGAVNIENDGDIVISADTVVYYGGKILEKPKSEEDALQMLKELSGKTHEVYTGYAIKSKEKTVCDFCRTEVRFRVLQDEEILAYIKTGEPMDKAGAYGIQGIGALLVEGINGDYANVVGLPISPLMRELRESFSFDYYAKKK